MLQWWAEQQTAYHRLHDAVSLALEEMEALQKLADSRSAADCCPKCGRRMDFSPKEVDPPVDDSDDDDFEVDDSVEDDSGGENSTPGGDDDDFSDTSHHDSERRCGRRRFFPAGTGMIVGSRECADKSLRRHLRPDGPQARTQSIEKTAGGKDGS